MKSGQICLCVGLKITVDPNLRVNKYPMPKAEDILNQFVGCRMFCCMDLSQPYLQLEVEKPSRELLTIIINGLHSHWDILFGLKNEAAYLDDILIRGKDKQERTKNFEAHNVKINTHKSEFTVRVNHLQNQRLKKSCQLLHLKMSQNLSHICQFLITIDSPSQCVLTCFSSFMTSYARSSNCEIAFNKSKLCLSEKPLLAVFDPTKGIMLHVNSSEYGVGAILSHIIDGVDYPITSESATLTATQRNYGQLDKEALFVIFGVKKFNKYLYSHSFTKVCNHQPLKTLFSEAKRLPHVASLQLLCWAVTICI
ncbi:hypothetical protein PR048_003383 [Dryococelus australis]|uniref:Reverse transcriptase/retrotransposon-derived protein RNase H-like domain-containing protein n=1 Tax=Dryococelus australis TaxID=614101 RepID=A0ABQ9IMV9_9NEOP|nr:hypothetical protein PR048_003383 [Dryococelus australis]